MHWPVLVTARMRITVAVATGDLLIARSSQVVRRETANLLFVGSIPTSASILFLTSWGGPTGPNEIETQ